MYNNCFGGNNCLWIIILLILFCGCGNTGMCGTANTGNGCGNGCGGNHDCCCEPLDDPIGTTSRVAPTGTFLTH